MAAQYDVNLEKCALLKCLCGSAFAAGQAPVRSLRAVVLESGLEMFFYRLGLVGIWTRTCLGLGHRTRQMF